MLLIALKFLCVLQMRRLVYLYKSHIKMNGYDHLDLMVTNAF